MDILIAYASVEGQTKKIADHAVATLQAAGHRAVLHDTNETAPTPAFNDFDRIVLAASIHRGRHPQKFEKFVATHLDRLSSRRTLLLSVSLCAAFPEGVDEARSYIDELSRRTGLAPDVTALIPGALQYDKYLDYEAMVVRLVALHLRQYYLESEDREFTDWSALDTHLLSFVSGPETATR